MVKERFTKIMTVHFVDGGIKAASPVTTADVKRALEECSNEQLDAFLDAIGFERARRAIFSTEAEEEIALDAMYD